MSRQVPKMKDMMKEGDQEGGVIRKSCSWNPGLVTNQQKLKTADLGKGQPILFA